MEEDDISAFLSYLRGVKNASLHTIRNYEIDLKHFYKHVGSCTSDKKILREYLASLYHAKLSKRTVARKLSALRSFFKHLTKEGKIVSNPMLEIETPKQKRGLPKTITYEQVLHFFSLPKTEMYLGLRDRTIMEILYSTGIRVSELVMLDREHFNRYGAWIKVKGKGKKERIVPLTKVAIDYLCEYLHHPTRYLDTKEHQKEKDQRAIFLNRWGKRLTTRSVDRMFVGYKKCANIAASITPHTLRHSIATHLLENGLDLKSIQEILGHTTLATTTIYTEVSPKLKAEMYNKHHPLTLLKAITHD